MRGLSTKLSSTLRILFFIFIFFWCAIILRIQDNCRNLDFGILSYYGLNIMLKIQNEWFVIISCIAILFL